jgi:2-haloacid dehalogenase
VSRFAGVTHLTFDCYGTLIDWETGILRAIEPLLKKRGVVIDAARILRLFVIHEALLEAGAWQPYRSVLRGVLAAMSEDMGITLTLHESNALADSLPHWPPFDDTVAALRVLKKRFRLVVVSNTDDALFAETAKSLEVSFDEIVTAEQVRSYKPAEAHFLEALRRMGVPPSQVLHVAQSLYHDHVPAQRLGFHTARIDRLSRLRGTGLAPEENVTPEWSGPDLATLAAILKEG